MAKRAAEIAAPKKYGGSHVARKIQKCCFLKSAHFHTFIIPLFRDILSIPHFITLRGKLCPKMPEAIRNIKNEEERT